MLPRPISLLASFALGLTIASAEQVIFGEIMYHPAGSAPEFIEIQNLSATPRDIADWRFSNGVTFEFPPFDPGDDQAHILKAFERILVTSADEATLRAAYTIPASTRVFGPWTGSLSNGGERVTLKDKNGITQSSVSYRDSVRWPVAADGTGHSLVVRNPDRLVDDWHNWRASAANGGSPGEEDPEPAGAARSLRLSEVAFAAGLGEVEWVEVLNTGTAAVSSDPLFLATQPDLSDKVGLGGSVGAGGYASWDVPFAVAAGGDSTQLFLIDANDTVIDATLIRRPVTRDAVQTFPAGSSEWYSTSTKTRDAANDPDRSEDIVINEIMYDPPSDQRTGEFIELYNRGGATVDLSGWAFVDGVDFTFPTGTELAPGAYLVIAADASWMANAYGGIPLIGDFEGTLRDSGELVRLEDNWDNLADQVDYLPSGDWPELADGDGSSMELRHPEMDNGSPSAWADSDERGKSSMQTFTYTGTYEELNSGSYNVSERRELHLHLVGDSHILLENITMKKDGTGGNELQNVASQSTTGSSADGWLVQGNHSASYVDNGQLHLISTGHGDNKANRSEIDCTGLQDNSSYTISFDARWIYGKPRLIAQTWDHSVGNSFLIPIPNNLGSPGSANSALLASAAPAVTGLLHSPAVPSSSDPVVVTARVDPAAPGFSIDVVHRLDNINGNGTWNTTAMADDGSGGDALAGDGVFSARLTQYQSNSSIVQFYVEATGAGGEKTTLPKLGADRPAMWVVDSRSVASDLRTQRFVISQYDRDTLNSGSGYSAKYNYAFPRMSNQYFNATFISNERDIYYNAELRKSGSPFTRSNGNGLEHGKWKLPGDRLFRGRRKSVIDPSVNHNDRIARYFLYLMGQPGSEAEFVRVVINTSGISVRDDQEPIANDYLDRNYDDGTDGILLRIDDEWWFGDTFDGNRFNRNNRNADWGFKNTTNPVRYHTEWLMRSREADYEYTPFVEFVQKVGQNTFTRPQLERMFDIDRNALVAAVRGYDGDWDSLTLRRGKNGYFYRRTDGRWQMVHWDGDRTFENSGEVILGTLPGIPTVFNTPYVRRSMNYYMHELLTKHTKGSARTAAWLQAEENASSYYSVSSTYANWFNSRESAAQNFIGDPFDNTNFAVSMQDTHPNPEVDLATGIRYIDYGDKWDFNDQNLDLGTAWKDAGYTYTHAGWTMEGDAGNSGGLYGFESSALPAPGINTAFLNSSDAANHITYYLRKEFTYSGPTAGVTITIDQIVDDGATYYLNGTPLGGVGVQDNPGWKTTANRTVGNAAEELGVVTVDGSALVDGTNVLAVEVHQTNSGSSDCVFGARLSISAPVTSSLLINEVLPAGAGSGFVEFYNPTGSAIDLDGYHLSDTPGDLDKFQISSSIVVPSMGLASVGYTESSLSVGDPTVVYLTAPDGTTVVNAVDTSMPLDGRSLGREPDGSLNWLLFSSPTRDAANTSGPTSANIITLNGTSPSDVFEVRVSGQPGATFEWVSETGWTLSGIQLASGVNSLDIEGIDREGTIVQSLNFPITKNGNAPPIMELDTDPESLNLGVGEVLELDASGSSDPEGGDLTFTWTQPTSPHTDLTGAGASASASFTRPGHYEFTVTGEDDQDQQSGTTREATVYNGNDFDSFGDTSLGASWTTENLELLDNYSPSAWYSLGKVPGKFVLQMLGDSAKPLSGPGVPSLVRAVPDGESWSVVTDLKLTGAQFGDFQSGLIVGLDEAGTAATYAFALENGSSLSAIRVVSGIATGLASMPWDKSNAAIRIRREGSSLYFEYRTGTEWLELHARDIDANSQATKGGLFTATDTAQAVQTEFDYFILVDPGTSSPAFADLRITELMYNHPSDALVEFIELTNTSATTALDLGGVSFDAGRPFNAFTMPAASLAAGESAVIVPDNAAFITEYGAAPRILAEWPGGALSNGGERIVIRDPLGNPIHDFSYDDENGWPTAADGGGSSLEVIDVEGDYNDPANWRASGVAGGTPGIDSNSIDTDGDGLSDGREADLGTNPYSADSDGDGMGDGAEAAAGTDPLDQTSKFSITGSARNLATGAVTVTWSSQPGKTYRLEFSETLGDGSWQTVPGAESIASQGSSTSFEDSGATLLDTKRLYRTSLAVPQP